MRILPALILASSLTLSACDAGLPGDAATQAAELRTVQFQVQGMTCGGCEQAITQALLLQDDVLEAGADHKAGTAWAKVGPKAAEPGVLAAVIDSLGYQASATPSEP